MALASCLRGKARSVLENIEDVENLELKSKSILIAIWRRAFVAKFLFRTNCKQKFGESFAVLGMKFERLARRA